MLPGLLLVTTATSCAFFDYWRVAETCVADIDCPSGLVCDGGACVEAVDRSDGEGDGEGEGEPCPAAPVNSLRVQVVDEVTAFPICDAVVNAVDGTFIETLSPTGAGADCEYEGVPDRAGAYTISAEHPAYLGEEFPVPILVQLDDCGHAITRRVELPLAPD